MTRILISGLIWLMLSLTAIAQSPLDELFQQHEAAISKASRKTIDPVLEALIASGDPAVPGFLEKWRAKEIWQRKEDKRFFFVETVDKNILRLIDIATGAPAGEVDKKDLKQLKPNSGVRGVIATALVQFQLSDPDPPGVRMP